MAHYVHLVTLFSVTLKSVLSLPRLPCPSDNKGVSEEDLALAMTMLLGSRSRVYGKAGAPPKPGKFLLSKTGKIR